MALPTSGPISGSQISTELGLVPGNISLGGMADSASFSAPDAYSDFYGFSSLKSAFRYNGTVGKPVFECDISRAITTQFWHNGSNFLPANGDTCYLSTNTSGFKLPNGNYSLSFNSRTGTPTSVITISGGAGVISFATLCIM
tara:strand:+ start:455 stop:880 length:426 start_codon:yes stop_codon:yes gene_type:complete